MLAQGENGTKRSWPSSLLFNEVPKHLSKELQRPAALMTAFGTRLPPLLGFINKGIVLRPEKLQSPTLSGLPLRSHASTFKEHPSTFKLCPMSFKVLGRITWSFQMTSLKYWPLLIIPCSGNSWSGPPSDTILNFFLPFTPQIILSIHLITSSWNAHLLGLLFCELALLYYSHSYLHFSPITPSPVSQRECPDTDGTTYTIAHTGNLGLSSPSLFLLSQYLGPFSH